jgi:hypothetical protein
MNAVVSPRAFVTLAAGLAAATALAGCIAMSSSEAQTVAGTLVKEGDWFVKTGCTTCHSVSVYGIWNLAATAPDLSFAVEDVPNRFGRSLEDFLREPTGTMGMVLSSRILLTDQERAIAVEQLKEAYRRHLERSGAAPLPSH